MSEPHDRHAHLRTAIHNLPAHVYPFTIELFALDDPDGAAGPIYTLQVPEQGVVTLPDRAELGQPAWLRLTYADGRVDDIWPPQIHPSRDRTLTPGALTPGTVPTQAQSVTDAKLRIAAHGWMIQGVEDAHDASGADDYIFTVGLTQAGLPELVWEGIPRNPVGKSAAVAIINSLARRSLDLELRAGGVYPSGLGDDTRVTVVDKQLGRPLKLADSVYGAERVRYLVIEPVMDDSA